MNRCRPQGIVELNQSLGRSGGGMSGSDFDPLSAIVRGVGLILVAKHAARQLGSCAALLESEFQAQSPPRGLRFPQR